MTRLRSPIPLLLLLAACAAARTAEHFTLPAIRSEWPPVRQLALRGDPAAEPFAVAMDGAVAAGDSSAMVAALVPIERAAVAGVALRLQLGEVGTNGAGSLREQVAQFGRAVRAYAEGSHR